MRITKSLLISVTPLLATLLAPFSVQAQDSLNPCGNQGFSGSSATINQFNNLCDLSFSGGTFQHILIIMFIAAVLVALFFLVWGGIQWILSGGEKGKVDNARKLI